MGQVEFSDTRFLPYVVLFAAIMISLGAVWLRRRSLIVGFYGRGGGRLHGQPRAFCFVFLLLLTGIALGLSLCSPYIRKEEPYDVHEPLEVVVLLDISKSMLAPAAEDPCGPSRLELASREAGNLIGIMEREREVKAALVVFARYAYPAVPVPTDDYLLLRRRLKMETEPANVLSMPEGSDHWYALERAVNLFGDEEPAKRILAIITDGEPDTPGGGRGGKKALSLRALRDKGIEAYVIGVGEPGLVRHVPLSRLPGGCPDEDKGYMVQRGGEDRGRRMMTATDTASLKALASELNGKYLHSSNGRSLAHEAGEPILKGRKKLGVMYGTAHFDLSEYLIVAALLMMAVLVLIRTP